MLDIKLNSQVSNIDLETGNIINVDVSLNSQEFSGDIQSEFRYIQLNKIFETGIFATGIFE